MSRSKRQKVLLLTYARNVPPAKPCASIPREAGWKLELELCLALKSMGIEVKVLGIEEDLHIIREAAASFRPDLAFNLLDAFRGETLLDHNVASYLELIGLPYTGCNPRGLLLGRDKGLSKKLLTYHQIPVPEFAVFPRYRRITLPPHLKFPLFVKPLTEQGSFGIAQASVVDSESKLRERVEFLHEVTGTDAIAETYIAGRELYVGLWGNAKVATLPVWEMRFGSKSSDRHPIATERAKWNSGYRKKHRIASGKAQLDESTIRRVQLICKQAYRVLGLSGYARFDLRLDRRGQPFILEANPNPHLGKTEDFSRSALAAGVSYEALIARILALGLQWKSNLLQAA